MGAEEETIADHGLGVGKKYLSAGVLAADQLLPCH